MKKPSKKKVEEELNQFEDDLKIFLKKHNMTLEGLADRIDWMFSENAEDFQERVNRG